MAGGTTAGGATSVTIIIAIVLATIARRVIAEITARAATAGHETKMRRSP